MKSLTTKKKYIFNADLIRVVAILGVVGIHTLNSIYSRPDFFNGSVWWFSYLLNVIFRTSVPMFVILSGYLVLGKKTSIKDNLLRIKSRILIPLISFYSILHIFNFLAAYARKEPYNYLEILINLANSTSSHLYFLVILVFLYFLIPLFQPLFETNNKDKIKTIMMFFFANSILSTFITYFSFRNVNIFNTFTVWILWIGYFLFGQWYKKYNLQISSKALAVTFLISYLFTAIFGYLNLYWHYNGNDIFYIVGRTYAEEYLSIGVVLMSLSLFSLLMRIQPNKLFNNKRFISIIKKVSLLTYGIYLIHPMVMEYFNKFQGITPDSPTMPNLWFFAFANTAITLIVSSLLIVIIQKIPYLKKIVGII